jgi:hypothetical protein
MGQGCLRLDLCGLMEAEVRLGNTDRSSGR